MKCARCGHDSTYPQRSGKVCPGCRGKFAFEPREGDRWNDMVFARLIANVSAQGRIQFAREHVYYELLRKLNREKKGLRRWSYAVATVTGGAAYFLPIPFGVFFFPAAVWAGLSLYGRLKDPQAPLTEVEFNRFWATWIMVHGQPKGYFLRPEYNKEKVSKAIASDLAGFSFDRAVICDRARTADMLIANNFHFENNCAVLTIDGYPEYSFDVVKEMLRDNPKLTVYALHDATGPGCRMAHKLATDPGWFKDRAKVVDVGLRPKQAKKYHGYMQPHDGRGKVEGAGLRDDEAKWLQAWTLELAVLPPEQAIKRLHKAIVAHEAKPEEDDAVVGGEWEFDVDDDSLDGDADASDGGSDGFG